MFIMQDNPVFFAFGLTLFAGLSTGIGSALAFFARRTNTRFLSASLGFSAGVMLYVSMIEIFPKAREAMVVPFGATKAYWYTTLAFFCGVLLIALIDQLVPAIENPHEMRMLEELTPSEEEVAKKSVQESQLLRMGLFSALAIAIHNFPEGLATFASALKDPVLGVSIAVAIAIHNIPEGIAVSIPLYYATGSRRKAFLLSFLSGLAEPVGAVIGYFFLYRFFDDRAFGFLFAGVAGIMVYIALDELLPSAEKYGEHHLAIGGVISGMMVMAVSLLLFA